VVGIPITGLFCRSCPFLVSLSHKFIMRCLKKGFVSHIGGQMGEISCGPEFLKYWVLAISSHRMIRMDYEFAFDL
jgi:hypothetical protein